MPSVELKCSLVPGLIEAALARGLQDITLAIPRDRRVAKRGVRDVLILAFPPDLCRVIYTTNSIESLNSTRVSRRLAQGRLVDGQTVTDWNRARRKHRHPDAIRPHSIERNVLR
jgi:hypothetical protein